MIRQLADKPNTIDSREILERIDELEDDEGILDEEDKDELTELRDVVEQLGSEAEYGMTLIREDYFEEYAEEYAVDIGAIPNDFQWPLYCIDWGQAARELKHDYTAVEFEGETYYYRLVMI